ncbi:MAG: energy transducer TonB [Sphingomonas sp.]
MSLLIASLALIATQQATKPVPVKPQTWLTNDDYPRAALRAGQQGVVSFRLDVGADGKVVTCTVTVSSGYQVLDDATCAIMKKRALFKPARDGKGVPIPFSWSSRFTWELPN